MPDLLDQVLDRLRSITDPYHRLSKAEELDEALVAARSAVTTVKKNAINELRDRTTGYGTIAGRLGVTKTRVQQIANTADKHGPVVISLRDESGCWHGQRGFAPSSNAVEARMAHPFQPANESHPLYDQILIARCVDLPYDQRVSLYALHLRDEDGSIRPTRMTLDVFDILFDTAAAQDIAAD